MDFKIETVSISKSEKKETRGRKAKYPIAKLQIGQSFIVKKDGKVSRRLLTTVINQYKRNHNKSASFEIKENPKSFRIYRIA